MDAWTLMQPYASLVVLGLKPWETRQVGTVIPRKVVGERIAIHAGKDTEMLDGISGDPELLAHMRALLAPLGIGRNLYDLPRSAVLGTAMVAGAWKVRNYSPVAAEMIIHDAEPGSRDDALQARGAAPAHPTGWRTKTDLLGNYAAGRRVILLTDVERFATPQAARGYQGFWPWKQQEALL